MKLVFLDIDGVLAPHGRPNPDVWCAETGARLKRLIDATGALVVLVSSWPEADARMMLAEHGIALHDALAERDRLGFSGRHGYTAREAGIIEYIERHSPDAWIWLDDFGKLYGPLKNEHRGKPLNERMYEPHPLADGYIETDWYCDEGEVSGAGFDEARYDKAFGILKGRE